MIRRATGRLVGRLEAHRTWQALEARPGVYDALTYATPLARHLVSLGVSGGASPSTVHLMIPSFAPADRYAGVATALRFAGLVAAERGARLDVVTTDAVPAAMLPSYTADLRELSGDAGATVRSLGTGPVSVCTDDLWVATYWVTAHLLQIAARDGVVDPARVCYLVQDYEPGFFEWSTSAAVASSTYHAGFLPAVNSAPLQRHLAREEGLEVPDAFTFAPALDDDRLAAVAGGRRPVGADGVRIFFYARPHKPRNLYPVGLTALRVFAALRRADPRLSAIPVTVVSAGGDPVHLGLDGIAEQAVGRTDWDRYYDLLATCDVTLSLMMSPHPSHPPLETAVSGGLAVTNAFRDARDGLHPNLVVARADPDALAAALADAVLAAAAGRDTSFRPLVAGVLGGDMSDVALRVAGNLA